MRQPDMRIELNGFTITKLLVKTLKFVKLVEPNATIRYSTLEDHDYFNEVYEKRIRLNKLKAHRYLC